MMLLKVHKLMFLCCLGTFTNVGSTEIKMPVIKYRRLPGCNISLRIELLTKSNDGMSSPLPATKPKYNIGRLDLRIGLVTYAQEHPIFRKYYLIHVDIGSRIERRSITRLAPYQQRIELLNNTVVVVCNMKQKVKGLLSDCFVLYAQDDELGEYLLPPAEARPGDRVFAPGYPFDPLQDWPFLPGGKKLFKETTRKLRISSRDIVKYHKTPLCTEHGNIKTYKSSESKIRI